MFYVFPTAQDIARFVSAQMHQLIRTQQRLVLGLATGSTMKPVYAQFIDKYQEQNCSLEHVHCFNLDEYIGLPAEHPQTYAAYMQKHLYTHLPFVQNRSEEHTSELQSRGHLVCRLLLEKKKSAKQQSD